jgi:hypothetical protein
LEVLIPAYTGATEEYDGNSWTTSNPFSTARQNLAGAGIQTAALAFGGYDTNSYMQQKNMMELVGLALII